MQIYFTNIWHPQIEIRYKLKWFHTREDPSAVVLRSTFRYKYIECQGGWHSFHFFSFFFFSRKSAINLSVKKIFVLRGREACDKKYFLTNVDYTKIAWKSVTINIWEQKTWWNLLRTKVDGSRLRDHKHAIGYFCSRKMSVTLFDRIGRCFFLQSFKLFGFCSHSDTRPNERSRNNRARARTHTK